MVCVNVYESGLHDDHVQRARRSTFNGSGCARRSSLKRHDQHVVFSTQGRVTGVHQWQCAGRAPTAGEVCGRDAPPAPPRLHRRPHQRARGAGACTFLKDLCRLS